MTIKAESESTGEIFKVSQFPQILPLAENTIMDSVESDLVIIDPNSVRIEHFKVDRGDKYVCGRSHVLHEAEINDESVVVLYPEGNGESTRVRIIWERDPLVVTIKNRLLNRR